jgi:serine protease Do
MTQSKNRRSGRKIGYIGLFAAAGLGAWQILGHSSIGRADLIDPRLAPDPYPQATPVRVAAVTALISPAVVEVEANQPEFRNGKEQPSRDIGSGVMFDTQGHILTNYHVAGRASEIYVILYNKERVAARLVGADHWTDLAVLQLDMEAVNAKKMDLVAGDFGSSSSLVVGQDVMAFGTPYGLARTVTRGSVSNTDRTFSDQGAGMDIDGYETGDFCNWIQMDVPINPGNSGGPLVDMNGKVVGINTRGGGQNLNFAIPIDIAKPVIAAILKSGISSHRGHVDRTDMGWRLQYMNFREKDPSIDVNKGVYIDDVDRLGPAKDAGVQSGDILITVNGEATNARFPEELAPVANRLANLPVDQDVQLTIKRGNQMLGLTARPVPLQGLLGNEEDEKSLEKWGASVRAVTRRFAVANQLDTTSGVWITSISEALPVQQAKLQRGDVIIDVDGKRVTDFASFQKIYDACVKRDEPTTLLVIQRGRSTINRALDIKQYAPSSAPNDQ